MTDKIIQITTIPSTATHASETMGLSENGNLYWYDSRAGEWSFWCASPEVKD